MSDTLKLLAQPRLTSYTGGIVEKPVEFPYYFCRKFYGKL